MFYRITPDYHKRFRYAWKDASFAGFRNRECPECGRAVMQLSFNDQQHTLMLEGGMAYPDHLAFTGAGKQLFLLSDRALECLREKGITGFRNGEPITICDQSGNSVYDGTVYQHLDITGRIDLDYAAMQLKKKRQCAACGQYDWNRQRMPKLVLDAVTWDGSDLCRISGMTGYLVCSERFRTAILEGDLKGFCFTRL